MQVILTSKINGLGNVGDVIEVKNGFAKNFLFPKKKAIYNSPSNHKVFATQKADIEKKEGEILEQAKKSKSEFNNKEVIIIENASDDGRLYGSVNATTIVNKLKEVTKLSLSKSDIIIGKPIKDIGIYPIKIHLHSDVFINISLIVTRNELEIDALKKSLLDKNKKSDEDLEEEIEEKA